MDAPRQAEDQARRRRLRQAGGWALVALLLTLLGQHYNRRRAALSPPAELAGEAGFIPGETPFAEAVEQPDRDPFAGPAAPTAEETGDNEDHGTAAPTDSGDTETVAPVVVPDVTPAEPPIFDTPRPEPEPAPEPEPEPDIEPVTPRPSRPALPSKDALKALDPTHPPEFGAPPRPGDGELTLLACVIGPRPEAVFRVEGAVRRVPRGGEVAGYRLEEIHLREVLLVGDGHRFKLTLTEGRRLGGTRTAPAESPAKPAAKEPERPAPELVPAPEEEGPFVEPPARRGREGGPFSAGATSRPPLGPALPPVTAPVSDRTTGNRS